MVIRSGHLAHLHNRFRWLCMSMLLEAKASFLNPVVVKEACSFIPSKDSVTPYRRVFTEMRFILCTWFGEFCSYCSLTALPGPAWVLLNWICKKLISSLYMVVFLKVWGVVKSCDCSKGRGKMKSKDDAEDTNL